MDKQIAFVQRTGPAFRVNEIQAAHAELDRAGIARFFGERPLTLTERLARVTGELMALRQTRSQS